MLEPNKIAGGFAGCQVFRYSVMLGLRFTLRPSTGVVGSSLQAPTRTPKRRPEFIGVVRRRHSGDSTHLYVAPI